MNFHWILTLLVILASDRTVHSEKFKQIIDYYRISKTQMSFICGQAHHQIDISDKNETFFIAESLHGFKCEDIEIIKFVNCERPQIPKDVFKKFSSAKVIDLSHLGIENLTIGDFPKLTTLNASHNALTNIPANAFLQMPKLFTLDLSFNRIRELNVKSFEQLVELSDLRLSHNQIKELPLFLFMQTKSLVKLDLSQNGLQKLESGIFSNLTKLEVLDLSHNEFETLNASIFPQWSNRFKLLSIANNKVHMLYGFEIKRMPNARVIGIDSNRFSRFYFINDIEAEKFLKFISSLLIILCMIIEIGIGILMVLRHVVPRVMISHPTELWFV